MDTNTDNDPTTRATTKKPQTVHQLLLSGELDRAKRLVNEDLNLAKSKDESGRLPIHWAASLGYKEVFEFLLTLVDDVDVRGDSGLTPLIIAASAGNEPIVKLLLDKGADVNAKNNNGHSSLQYSSSKNNFEIVDLLLKQNADPNIADEMSATPLHRAASQGHSKVVQLLVTSCAGRIDLNPKDRSGNTPLHLACEEDRAEDAKFLIRNGARIDVENKEEKTPFDLASTSTRSILNAFVASLDQ